MITITSQTDVTLRINVTGVLLAGTNTAILHFHCSALLPFPSPSDSFHALNFLFVGMGEGLNKVTIV